MTDKLENIKPDNVQNRIYPIRDQQVMLDSELAELYGVGTKVLNQAVKRNMERFPKEFRFQLTKEEKDELVTNCDHLQNLKFSPTEPHVFTEQGVAMLSAVLRSETAVKVSIQIMQAFVNMRKFIANNAILFQRLEKVEHKQLETDKKFEQIFTAIERKEIQPKQGIFFDGQIFDAHALVSKIVRSAKKSIVIIDNYIDDTVLTLLIKRKKNIPVTIFTRTISRQLELDVQKYNQQYSKVTVKELKTAHDRFVIIDDNTVYHIGASLKDLGKKWFAFSKMEKEGLKVLDKLGRI